MVAIFINKLPENAALRSKMMQENESILKIKGQLGGKQHLPKHQHIHQWRRHFGSEWAAFVESKQSSVESIVVWRASCGGATRVISFNTSMPSRSSLACCKVHLPPSLMGTTTTLVNLAVGVRLIRSLGCTS